MKIPIARRVSRVRSLSIEALNSLYDELVYNVSSESQSMCQSFSSNFFP